MSHHDFINVCRYGNNFHLKSDRYIQSVYPLKLYNCITIPNSIDVLFFMTTLEVLQVSTVFSFSFPTPRAYRHFSVCLQWYSLMIS